MKTTYMIQGIIAFCAVFLMVQSCTEDKIYDVGGWGKNKVAFTATNLDLDTIYSVESSRCDDYFDLEYHYTEIPLTFFRETYYGDTIQQTTTLYTDRVSEIWSGGYNNIQVTLQPTDSTEKAIFTMPDGSTFNASTEHPTFIWTPDSTLRGGYYDYTNTLIQAKSTYTKNSTSYQKEGYIFVNLNPELYYDRSDKKWYISNWLK